MRTSRVITVSSAPKLRISRTKSWSTEANPSAVATATGKKVIRATTTSLGRIENPNQMTSTAAIAGIGMVWLATSHG